MASKCTECGNTESYNFALNIGLCNPCIGERLEELEADVCPSWMGKEKGCSEAQDVKELEAKLEQHRWIPVSERLPEKTEEDLRPEVLVYDGESVTGTLWRHYSFGWDFETDRGKPTHWKPIILP